MANMINANYAQLYKSTSQLGKGANAVKGASAKASEAAKDLSAMFGKDVSVELSGDGLAALANQRKEAVNNEESSGGSAVGAEQKLSAKAQDFLAKLREKYGDYDFIITENMDDTQGLMEQGTKQYSVILTNEELEKMADDEEYADKVMGNVETAVDKLKGIAEKGGLGEGVQFAHIGISFDNDGNMKLFAQLEKLSADQQERLEKLKEKRAEEAEAAAKQAEEDKAAQPEDEDEWEYMPVKKAMVEADTEEELMEKILGIDWDSIEAS